MALTLDANGLVVDTLQEIATAIGNDQLSTIDPGLSQDDDDPLRQMNLIVSRELAEVAEAIQVAYNAFDIDNAEGTQLDNIGAFKGRPRLQAANPKVNITLNLAAGAAVSIGDVVKNSGNNAEQWLSLAAFTTTAAGYYPTVFQAATPDLVALPGRLTVIPAITGWVSATNPAASTAATTREGDEVYRLRLKTNKDTENGAGTLDSIVDEVSQLDGVQSADGRENTSLQVDSVLGMPGMSFEIIIDDGSGTGADPSVIAQTIWDNKPPGGRSYGRNTQGFAFDKKGRPHLVNWTRVTRIRLGVTLTVYVLPGYNDTLQTPQIKQDMINYVATLKSGQNVIATRLKDAAIKQPLTEDISDFLLRTIPGGGGDASLAIAPTERATLAAADINLTIVQLTEVIP